MFEIGRLRFRVKPQAVAFDRERIVNVVGKEQSRSQSLGKNRIECGTPLGNGIQSDV